ncbi:MAG TPA: pyridoxamine 5'-phosphate oxidase [Verrucomicrobiae bacterium]|jgi:pyridoxamine 5'-phosphate oxidase|nr:pyridoxamine 5'-phosphate oxidase [Verrucomicrobiae bacterium]
MTDPAKLFYDYSHTPLTEKMAGPDPLRLFDRWYRQAVRAKVLMPHAMCLATAGKTPHARMVLLKAYGKQGFVFFSNYQSVKGRDLAARPRAALLFYWPQVQRQVRIEGRVKKTPRGESERYFHSRQKEYQIAALASHRQSAVIPDRAWLDKQYRDLEKKYRGREIPHPPSWGGYVVVPDAFEFWQGQPSRLHDRIHYRKSRGRWKRERLTP